jgi:hypothetical protein
VNGRICKSFLKNLKIIIIFQKKIIFAIVILVGILSKNISYVVWSGMTQKKSKILKRLVGIGMKSLGIVKEEAV